MADGDSELVIRTEDSPPETDLKVESAIDAAQRFTAAGGAVVVAPFDIAIGKCVVVADPWGNHLVLLDTTKGAPANGRKGIRGHLTGQTRVRGLDCAADDNTIAPSPEAQDRSDV